MKNHNESLNYQIKSLFFRLSKLSLILSLFLIMIFQTGCATKDEEFPVITSVKVDGNVVTIEANDNVGVTTYISVSNPRQPSLTDENWQESNTITLTEDGSYYIWVKDASDNLAQYSKIIEMNYNLAQKFDHLNWLTPAEGTRVVDGVTYNLAELKNEYGDLYRLVEPLTNEEIESRFTYLAEFMELQMVEATKIGYFNWYAESGLVTKNEVSSILADITYSIHNEIMKSENLILKPFKILYFYVRTTGLYEQTYPSSFTSITGACGLSPDIVNDIPFEHKNIFVRDLTMRYEIQLNIYEQLDLEPQYAIANWE